MEDGDDSNLTPATGDFENILEHFPYLKNEGLGQIRKEQQIADHTSSFDTIKASVNAVVQIKEDTDNSFGTRSGKNGQKSTDLKTKTHNNLSEVISDFENVNNNKYIKIEAKESDVEFVENLVENAIAVKPNVKFSLKGKLGHDMDTVIKSVREMLIEPVDVEETLYPDFVYNYSRKNKGEAIDDEALGIAMEVLGDVSGMDNLVDQKKKASVSPDIPDGIKRNYSLRKTTTSDTSSLTESFQVKKEDNTQRARYKEPSIAEIRASLLGTSTPMKTVFDDTEVKVENNTSDDLPILDDDLHEGFSDSESDLNNSELNDSSYNPTSKTDNIKLNKTNTVQTPKRGGRSDPENPFALTSPSFSDSTAKAILTTTQTSTATIVMVSIMSIGSREKLIPKIVNSKAAEGGLVSVLNPVEPQGNKATQVINEKQINSERTSIMSKLRQERSKSNESNGGKNSNIDRLDVNVVINDDQYVGHGENKRWLCKICPKSYTTKHNLVSHILDHSDVKPHLCLLCEKYFKQLSHLNTHMLTHDNVKPYVCTQCDKGFTQISHLKRHETVHMGSKPYICDICNRGFAYPSELRLHKEKHLSGKEKCSDCDKEFSTWEELNEHMVAKGHCSDLQCKLCDRIFRFPSQLRDHMITHAGSRPFTCTECGMNFMKEHHLKSHLFTHTGIRPHACPECGRAFNQKANMQRHMLIHNAKRAYKCEVCSKTFTQPQTLKAHMVVHSNSKPYKCNICGKQFGRQHNLQGHMHMHSDSKPFSCSICKSSFTLKGNLNRHKKVKHNLDESTEVMEEDAVNFLSSIFDRARDNQVDSPSENDQESRDSLSESRSGRKGRKSMPRKHVSRNPPTENVEDDVVEQLFTYSDEERENERTRVSNSNNTEQAEGSRRKRKRRVVYRYDDDIGDDFDESDTDNIDEQIANTKIKTESGANGSRPTRKRNRKSDADN